ILPPELENLRAVLQKRITEDVELSGVNVLARRHELVLRLPDTIVFRSGDAEVRPNAVKALRAIASEIAKRPVTIRVEGHTDNRPIKTVHFRSNWELSTARATSVIAELARSENDIAPERLSAAGYGEFHPVADNANADGRAQNRRVDLVLAVA